jgi:hypothetical protein
MALGLSTESGGGDYTPVCKYDARAGRWFRIDRHQDSAGNWTSDDVDISSGFQAVMDLENIEVGWMLFAAGVAPQWLMVKLGDPLPHRPTDQHKQGFRMQMKLGKSCGGDVREFASQAKAVIGAVDALHSEYEKGKAANPGKLPVVAMTGTTPIKTTGKGQTSTNYAPVFAITAWIDRPAELGGAGASAETAQAEKPKQEPKTEPAKELADVGAEF